MVVLVVEDDGLINMIALDELQRDGHEVVSAYNADEAIEILAATIFASSSPTSRCRVP